MRPMFDAMMDSLERSAAIREARSQQSGISRNDLVDELLAVAFTEAARGAEGQHRASNKALHATWIPTQSRLHSFPT
jgi:hypothetical protein